MRTADLSCASPAISRLLQLTGLLDALDATHPVDSVVADVLGSTRQAGSSDDIAVLALRWVGP
jgi:hypothetical protein